MIETVQRPELKYDVPFFNIGYVLRVGVLIQEGKKKRIQIYQGTLIAKYHTGRKATITIRRVFQDISVERVFLLHSPSIKYVGVLQRTKCCRAKLYYLRNLKGKATRLRERFFKLSKLLKSVFNLLFKSFLRSETVKIFFNI